VKKRIIASLLIIFTLVMPLQTLAVYDYSNPGDKNHFVYYKGSYDPETYPQKNLDSVFTTDEITLDGVLDDAYANAPVSNIENVKVLSAMSTALNPDAQPPTGTLRSVWDGSVLYLFVEVFDETPVFDTTTPANGGAMTSKPAVPSDRDSVIFGFDLYNDKVVYETDTSAVFTIDSTGNLTFFRNSNIPSLGSVHADPNHPEYTNRIKGYSAKETDNGYNVELALHIEGIGAQNGTQFGVDVQISNVQNKTASSYSRTSNTFWSHNQDSLYAEYDHERPNAVDWGNISLTGWNGTDDFAFSTWRLTNNIEYLESIRFPKGVWTEESQQALDLAVNTAKTLMEAIGTATSEDYPAYNVAADALEAAIAGLRWADTRYPDPMTLPDQFTLPNPYKFFGNDGNSERMVENSADWEERRAEILDLAQFYEYGYKPDAPDEMSITNLRWSTSSSCYVITASVRYGDVTKNLEYRLYMPTDAQLQQAGRISNVPVVLSFDGSISAYLQAGIAVLQIPSVTGGDNRTNNYAWGTRTGVFYELFPYSRDGENALKEVSSEMAAAWAASRGIDVLEILYTRNDILNGKNVGTLINPYKLAVTGFSINGKYAFVSAVFDDRIDVCIPGAAGATGPSPWRYVYAGQQYDFSDTNWAPNGSAVLTAFGTEFMANSVRHNRVRETETFRRFLTPGNFYKKVDGAYGYGTRLPFDQNDLVATLAPRAIIVENTVNDYNDGSVTDSLSLDIAKSFYNNLGYDADELLKYNYRTIKPTGDPHGNDSAQRSKSAEYLNYYFYGTPMSADTEEWLNTNPYALSVSNNKTESPYDYYYGGYNTITGGTGGVSGNDGWYYHTPIEDPDSDNASVVKALMAIEQGVYHIPLAGQSDEAAKIAWVENKANSLIPDGNEATATVDFSNGYEVSVTKGSVTKTAKLVVTEAQSYTVVFMDHDGSVLKSETVEEFQAANPPEDPKRDGYRFVGWDTDFSRVTQNLNVTAVYELTEENKLAQDKEALNIGFAVDDTENTVTKNLTLIATGEQHGSSITWQSDNEAVISNDGMVIRPSASDSDATVTLTATISRGELTDTKEFNLTVLRLEEGSYNMKILVSPENSGTVTGDGTYAQGTSVTVTAAANPDYRFVNWTENGVEVSTSSSYTFTMGSNDTILTANFVSTIIPVTNIPGVPTMINPTVMSGETPVSGGLLLTYASRNSGTISYARGGEYRYQNTSPAIVEIEPSNATYKNITWSVVQGNAEIYTYVRSYNSSYNVTVLKASNIGDTIVLRATITNGVSPGVDYVKDYTIEVVDPQVCTLASDIPGVPSTGYVGQELTLPESIVPEAIFSELQWSIKTSGTTAPDASLQGNKLTVSGVGNVVLTAKTLYDIRVMDNQQYPTQYTKDVTISFVLDPDTVAVEAAVAAIEAGTYQIPLSEQIDQETKTAWVQNAVNALIPEENGSTAEVTYNNGYEVTVSCGTVTRSATIIVTEVQEYNVTVQINPANSGTVSGEGMYAENDTVTLTATANNGYHFTGWSEDDNTVSTEPTYSFTMGNADRTLTANFAVNTYTVTFQDYDGTVLATDTVEEGSAATAPEDPERSGFIFTGWDVDFSNVTSDLIVTAQYVEESSSLTDAAKVAIDKAALSIGFADGDSASAVTEDITLTVTGAVYGSAITWQSSNTDIIGITGNVTRPTGENSNVTVTATISYNEDSDTKAFNLTVLKLDPVTYTVTFKDYDGTVLKTETVEEGHAATAPADPERSGFTFTGWDVDFSNVTSDLTVTALYTANPITYTVTFKDYDGTVLKTETVEEGHAATAPANPVRSGYTFTGWDVPFNNITSDLIVTAQYTINSNNDDDDDGGTPSKPPKTTPPSPTPAPVVTPTPTIAPEIKVTVEQEALTATTTTQATVDSDGRAEAAITQEHANSVIEKAMGEAKNQGDDTAARVAFRVETDEDAKKIEITLPKAAIDAAAGRNLDTLTVSTTIATITFDSDALKAISDESQEDVSISISKVEPETLSEEAQTLIGDRPVFDFSVTSGDKELFQFNGDVTVSIPYKPKADEDTNAIVIYYINAEGKLEIVTECYYDPATGTVKFTTNHFSQYAVGYNKVSFNDVLASAWYNNAVQFIAARNISNGTGNGNYSPDAKLSRAEFLVMAMRAYGITPDANTADNFTDAGNTWYTGYLAAAKRLGISKGIGDNKFAPDSSITRQEMFTMLFNVLKIAGKLPASKAGQPLSAFSDAEQVASWAGETMEFFTKAGIVKGSNGKLNPMSTATRAEMAQVLYNLLSK
jgi:uncharacterized repeat protein (TIGR02543 family)